MDTVEYPALTRSALHAPHTDLRQARGKAVCGGPHALKTKPLWRSSYYAIVWYHNFPLYGCSPGEIDPYPNNIKGYSPDIRHTMSKTKALHLSQHGGHEALAKVLEIFTFLLRDIDGY